MIGAGGNAFILMYHRVAEVAADPFSLCVTPRHFAEQMEVLHKYARPVPLRQLTEELRSEAGRDRSIVLTFDDGYADNLENAKPLLERSDIPATVFVTTGNLDQQREFWWDELERVFLQPGTLPGSLRLTIGGRSHAWELNGARHYDEDAFKRHRQWRFEQDAPTRRHALYSSLWHLLQPLPEAERRTVLDEVVNWAGCSAEVRPAYRTLSSKEVLELSRGDLVEIGAHTVTHPALPELPADLQQREVSQSKLRLEEMLGRRIGSFAYPYGSLSDQSVAIVRESGFDRACSTVSARVEPGTNPFQLPRVQVDDWDGEEFGRRLTEWFGGSTAGRAGTPRRSDWSPPTDGAGGWNLRVAEGNVARLGFPPDDPEGVRIAVERVATEQPFDIQLNRPRLKVLANQNYTIHFRARADQPRGIFLGFAQAHAPWSGLGLYKRIELTSEWQDFGEDLLVAAEDNNARIHFDMGGSPISVEISSVRLVSFSDAGTAARSPIEELDGLERYLDGYLHSEGLTFEEWMERFGSGTYRARNQIILDLLAPHRPKRLFEFACAGGFLAKLLLDGIPGIERYTCSNYSPRAVSYCQDQLAGYSNCDVTLLNADVMRSRDMENANLEEYDTFVTTSFEHIEHDLELIEKFPPNCRFVFCVAGFDDPEHARLFASPEQIRERYGDSLSISRIEEVGGSDRKFVCMAWTRPKTPVVSVIVPCKNPGIHFTGLLTSLARQTFDKCWEVIIVNNGLTAGERAAAEAFSDQLRLKVVEAKGKTNGAYARNVGVRTASGEILCFVDADDEVEPGYLTAMVAAMESHDFVTSRVDSVALNSQWVRGSQDPSWQETGVAIAFGFLPSPGINIALRRQLFESLGGFREDFSGAQEIEFSWRAQMTGGAAIHFVSDAVYRYRFRTTLSGMYRQGRNWGFSNVLLYSQFREHGMPGRSMRTAIKEWLDVGTQLLRVRSKSDLASVVAALGHCVGRVRGSLHYRVAYL